MEPFKWVSKTDDRFESSGTSKILNNIRLENNWSEEQLQQELENRITILRWMCKNKITDYKMLDGLFLITVNTLRSC